MAESSQEKPPRVPHEKWTMVSSKGDVTGEADSETSESSIEILDTSIDEGLPNVLNKQDDAVVMPGQPSASLGSDIGMNSEVTTDTNSDNGLLDSQDNMSCTELVSDPTEDEAEAVKYAIADLENETEQRGVGEESMDIFEGEDKAEASKNNTPEDSPSNCDLGNKEHIEEVLKCDDQPESGFESHIGLTDNSLDPSRGNPTTVDTTEVVAMICDFPLDDSIEELKDEETSNDPSELMLGACCSELLNEMSGNGLNSANEGAKASDHDGCDLENVGDTVGGNGKFDSDSDSDFICLESDGLRDLESVAYPAVNRDSGEERVPLRLSHSNSSIRPSFNFLQDAGAHREDDDEEDRYEDTESSTEDGIDDRIESEQSEAGSDPQMNDLGDLSSIADIGDLPLIAGDVARNYIHQPNQHVTTVLNTVVVLAAFLTMGLSLGIMMATDLEIEEWQTAYELQTRKVSDLQGQLAQLRLQQTVSSQMVEQKRKELHQSQHELNGYVGALELVATYEKDEPQFISLMQSVQQVVKSVAKCHTMGQKGWLKAPFCYMKNQGAVDELKSKLLAYSQVQNSRLGAPPSSRESSVTLEEAKLAEMDPILTENLENETVAETIKSYDPVAESKGDGGSNPINLSTENVSTSYVDSSEDPEKFVLHSSVKFAEESDKEDMLSGQDAYEDESSGAKWRAEGSNFGGQSHQEPKGARERMVVEEEEPLGECSVSAQQVQDKAQSIPLDIRQLQQSLTLEQERALHWQQLYLAERRQREHERESEEWEDLRDRQRWEKERERAEHVECLHKLMASNMSTLTQFLTGWNISVYDDFANLSMLLSSVAELRQSVISSVQQLGEGAEEILEKIRQEGEERVGSVNWADAVATKDVIVEYVHQIFENVERGVNDAFQEGDGEERSEEDHHFNKRKESRAENAEDDTHEEKDYEGKDNDRTERKWVRGFEKFLHGTRKSVGKFGKKLTSIVRRLRDMWSKKRPVLSSMVKQFRTKFVKITEKFVHHLSQDLHMKLFKKRPAQYSGIVDIHIDDVRELRGGWQEEILKNPCKVLGDYSAECNMDWKTLKSSMKAINKDFRELLKLTVHKKMSQKRLRKMGHKKAEWMRLKFAAFLEKWNESKFLLLTDWSWAKCQLRWWAHAERALSSTGRLPFVPHCPCNLIELSTAVEGGTGWLWKTFEESKSGVCFNKVPDDDDDDDGVEIEVDDEEDDDDMQVNLEREIEDSGIESDEEEMDTMRVDTEELDPRAQFESTQDNAKPNFTLVSEEELSHRFSRSTSFDDEDWDHERAKYRLHRRREKERSRSNSRKLKFEHPSEEPSDHWLFRKAEDRQQQREEAQRAQWLFERARDRRKNSDEGKRDQWSVYKQKGFKADKHDDDDDNDDELEDFEQLPNWFLKQAKERQRLRKKEHETDWLFERASDRRKEHHLWRDHGVQSNQRDHWEAKGHRKGKHSKQNPKHQQGRQHFRHSYGKVVTP